MATVIRTITFVIPSDLENLGQYISDLGQIDNPSLPGIYPRHYNPENGAVPLNYPIFDEDGNIRLRIDRKNFTDITEFTGESKLATRFSYNRGIYAQVSGAFVGFKIKIIDNRYPLRLLFEKLRLIQTSTLFTQKCYRTIEVRNAVRFDWQDYENGSRLTTRKGRIEEIVGESEGDGAVVSGRNQCKGEEELEDPPRFYCGPYTLTFRYADRLNLVY